MVRGTRYGYEEYSKSPPLKSLPRLGGGQRDIKSWVTIKIASSRLLGTRNDRTYYKFQSVSV
jgi:hypothetical protein